MSYSHPSKTKRLNSRLHFTSIGESLTKTSFASEADINVIVARFLRTGQKPDSPVPPSYLDTTAIPRGSDALMAVRTAALAFEALPFELRRKLDHDPNNLEKWLFDPANHQEAVQMGLIIPQEPVQGSKAAPVDKQADKASE